MQTRSPRTCLSSSPASWSQTTRTLQASAWKFCHLPECQYGLQIWSGGVLFVSNQFYWINVHQAWSLYLSSCKVPLEAIGRPNNNKHNYCVSSAGCLRCRRFLQGCTRNLNRLSHRRLSIVVCSKHQPDFGYTNASAFRQLPVFSFHLPLH